jgi:nicotinate-nucleotide pyrophosphorylase (carboxylating)
MRELDQETCVQAVESALLEDIGNGDVTSLATISTDLRSAAFMVAREPLIIAGLALAEATFKSLSPEIDVNLKYSDGDKLQQGQVLMEVTGPTRSILTAERVALNFIQRLSGIATLTRRFVDEIQGSSAKILDTRKTTPGWRQFEKYAVRCGGGQNHRFGLYDMILIKDNHLEALRDAKPNPIVAAVRAARLMFPKLKIEIEVDDLQQLPQVIESGADIALLDNMNTSELKTAVSILKEHAQTEASGAVSLSTVKSIAETGVDFISIGALTHSAPTVDIALDFVRS